MYHAAKSGKRKKPRLGGLCVVLTVVLAVLLLWALAGVGCFYMSGVFFVWVGLAIFVSSYFINTVFKKYTGELAEEQAAWEQADRERKQRKKMQKRGLL